MKLDEPAALTSVGRSWFVQRQIDHALFRTQRLTCGNDMVQDAGNVGHAGIFARAVISALRQNGEDR